MRFFKIIPSLLLLITGWTLLAANLWFTSVRSTIPLAIDAELVFKEKRLEKKAGVDDVFLLHLSAGRTLQVDKFVFDHVSNRTPLKKPPWGARLHIGETSLTLRWSKDFHRMLWLTPVAAAALLIMFIAALRGRGGV